MRSLITAANIAALAIALTTTGAYAQDAGGMGGGMGGMGGGRKGHQQSAAKKEPQAPKADENAYRAALKSVPNKPYDPWQGTR